jgi:hypothetical protein
VQLALAIFWLLYGGSLLLAENPTDDQNYLHIIFLTLAVAYLLYIIANYTPIFGVQAYLQITPEYLVQKPGLFRAKLPIAFEQIEILHISSHALHIKQLNGTAHYIDLSQIKKERDRKRVKEEIRQAALTHDFTLTQGPNP